MGRAAARPQRTVLDKISTIDLAPWRPWIPDAHQDSSGGGGGGAGDFNQDDDDDDDDVLDLTH